MLLRKTEKDQCTLSNVQQIRVTSMALDWMLDFPTKMIMGSVRYSAIVLATTKLIVLDTRDLSIRRVFSPSTGQEIPFTLGPEVGPCGQALEIQFGTLTEGQVVEFAVSYMTSPGSTALCWMTPEQTDNGTLPYLFSQCQAIHARSMLPCQDTPMVRCPYTAKVTHPSEFCVVMSALVKGQETVGDRVVTSYEQPKPIASYLIAIAAGDLVKVDISPRCAVYCDPTMRQSVTYEFADMEKYLTVAEDIAGPYEWGRYDVLVLPLSFPYGGMENPCMTFASPTIITGDRTMMDVIAHEISHSWTGNSVAPETWEDFWLNESFTVMLERKITSRIHGEKFFDMAAINGWQHLRDDVMRYGETHPYTALRPNLTGVDPDDSFSSVPYEKGFNLLCDIQRRVGVKPFETWLHKYIQDHKDRNVNTDLMVAHLQEHFANSPTVFDGIDWHLWFDCPGMPPVIPGFDVSMLDAVQATVARWAEVGYNTTEKARETSQWHHQQMVIMVQTLAESPIPLTASQLLRLDHDFNFTNGSNNADILLVWLSMCIKAKCTFHEGRLVNFLRIGRMKYARPLYRTLFSVAPDKAQKIFQQMRPKYHNIAQKMIAKDLGL